MGTNVASFGVIFMGPDADQRQNAIEDVKHEYGHSVHFSQIGIVNYAATVAILSLIGYLLYLQKTIILSHGNILQRYLVV